MRYRFDGFTPDKRRKFVKTLAKTGCWRDAARVAGISTTTADRWRSKDAAFARLCAAAIDEAASHIDTLAWERGVVGIEEPVWHHGKVVGMRVKRSDGVFRMLLMASNPKKYGRMGAAARPGDGPAGARGRQPRVASNEEVRRELAKRLKAYGVRIGATTRGTAPDSEPGE